MLLLLQHQPECNAYTLDGILSSGIPQDVLPVLTYNQGLDVQEPELDS